VEPGSVEAGGLGQDDITSQGIVAWGGPDTFGIETLVQDQPLVVGLVVEEKTVALDMDLAQARIGFHLVDKRAFRIHHAQVQAVQMGAFRRPGLRIV